MADESLFYRPRNPLWTRINVYLGGPTPSRADDPALRFDPTGVEHHASFGHGVTIRLRWDEVRVVAVLPGPVQGRQALCVYPVPQLPAPGAAAGEGRSGSGAALLKGFVSLFGTPIAVHWHHVRGPSLDTLARHLPGWTDGRITLAWTRAAP